MSYTAINIPVNIPQQASGVPAINVIELKEKIQAYVDDLYAHLMFANIDDERNAKFHSKRIQKLRAMSHRVQLTEQDIKEDDRLKYLLNK